MTKILHIVLYTTGQALLLQRDRLSVNTSMAFSCAFSFRTDSKFSCVNQCSLDCDQDFDGASDWQYRLDAVSPGDCRNDLLAKSCVIPVGVVNNLTTPNEEVARLLTNVTVHMGGKDWWDMRYSFDPTSVNFHTRYWTNEWEINISDISRIVDPMRLTYASIFSNEGIFDNAEDNCNRVKVYEHDSTDFNWQTGLELGFHRAHSLVDSFPPEWIPAVDESAFTFLPNIATLIQQWWLATNGLTPNGTAQKKLRLSLINHNAGPYVVNATWNAENFTRTFGVETFTTFNWRGPKPPEVCAHAETCHECTVTKRCYWCDMSMVPLDEWTDWSGWQSSMRARSDGSGCGIDPEACAFMGGTPLRDLDCLPQDPSF